MAPQLPLHGEDGPSVSPTVQADLRHQPPKSGGVTERCWLKYGCQWIAHGTVCGDVCDARRESW